jgi:cystathionine gamma-synthase
MRIETLAVHAGHSIDPATGAVATPIHLSTTFERDAEGGYPHGYIYGRSANPTRHALEEGLAALEGGEDAAAFGSGLAASSAVLQALAPGDHVIAPADVYHGMTKLLREVYMRWGLEVSLVDMTSPDDIKKAVGANTKLIWVETPSNPLLKITDIAAVAEIAHAAGAICAFDNTWAPIVQRPLELGADLVVHATTKYLGGHSDVTGGIVIAKSKTDFFERVREIQTTCGAVPSPFDCWLILRGMRSLPWRMRGHSECFQRDAFVRGARWARSCARGRGENGDLYPRDKFGRRGKSDRTPCLDQRRRSAHSAGIAPTVYRARASG